ncbi:MAG: ABC transporter ATP-binding protein [Planctomycetes bacterium]|nr:ABC transporter ATP-binding protein [Planctomycetota bacterium]
MAMAAITIDAVSKSYRRGEFALRDVTLEVAPGEIFGLLGPNGAGKTTLVKILLDLVRPTRGTTSLLSLPSRQVAARRRVGYLPEDHRFPEHHTPVSALLFFAGLSGVAPAVARPRIDALLAQVGLADAAGRKVRGFSKGMKQRLGLAQVLVAEPDLLFLDEPTDGIDPVGRAEIRGLLEQQRRAGRTIFLNSHLLSEVEQLCDRVGILARGELKRVGSVRELTQSAICWAITLSQPPGEALLAELVRAFGDARRAVSDGIPDPEAARTVELSLARDEAIDAVIDFLRARELSIRGVARKRTSLEAAFLDSVAGGGAAPGAAAGATA